MIIGKAAQKLLWIENEKCLEGIDFFLAKIRADKVID